MELEVYEKPIFMPMSFAVGEVKEVLLLQMSRDHSKEMLFYDRFSPSPKCFHTYEERRDKIVEKVKHEKNSQNFPCWTYIKKINTSTFGCMVTSLDLCPIYTYSRTQGL
jgi:hypothetical protein